MTATQQTATDTARRGQDATISAMDMWAETVKKMFVPLPTPDSKFPNAAEFLDNYFDVYFDYAEHVLATQREFAKGLMSVTTSAATKAEAAVQATTKDVQESAKTSAAKKS
ncbi:MAG: hypothetical protein ACRDUV_23370 [Pseudonocardiaceae bacterium]